MRLPLLLVILTSVILQAEPFHERSVIDYANRKADNAITRLQKKIDSGEVKIENKGETGRLEAVLKALNIPVDSQVLVFSRTSFHRKLISPENPRAMYFNDDVYVGWVRGAGVLEIGCSDPELGAVFYTFEQNPRSKTKFVREDSCLNCHASSRTGGEPGFMLRSIFPDRQGEPVSPAGEDRIDHSSPMRVRWGGWYVTAGEFSGRHRGNALLKKGDESYTLTPQAAKSTADLGRFFDDSPLLGKYSDIVSLMVMEHQAKFHNIMTQTKFRVQYALHHEEILNEALKETGRRDLTKRIISRAADELLSYMLFCDEISLKHLTVRGSSGFTESFSARGVRDSKGRSLYELDLEKRLMKYPCSYLIYSEQFKELPPELLEVVLSRLQGILQSDDLPERYIHLRRSRKALDEILKETLPLYSSATK